MYLEGVGDGVRESFGMCLEGVSDYRRMCLL